MPWHSLAPQDDISVERDITGAIKPSEQKPPLHFCPTGHVLFAIQGSLAEPPRTMGASIYGLGVFISCITISAIIVTAITNPNPDSPNMGAILSDVVSEKAQRTHIMGTQIIHLLVKLEYQLSDRIH